MKFVARYVTYRFALAMLTTALLSGGMYAQANFVYTNDDQAQNTVSGFAVTPNGILTPVPGSPFATGGNGGSGGFFAANRIGVAIVGKLLFASNSQSNDVSVFTIEPNTGVLTLVPGSPFALGPQPSRFNFLGSAVTATPDGRFLMASNGVNRTISVFSIGQSGMLTPIAGSPFFTSSNPDGLKVSPDGKFLAVGELPETEVVSAVEIFSIASDGSLALVYNLQGGQPAGVDIDCSSSFLYVGEAALQATVDAYKVAANGALTPLPGSPFRPGVGINSNVVMLSPDDKTLFVSNQFSNTITAFSVAPNGTLFLLAGSPFPMNGFIRFPTGMATNEDGTLLYVADFSGEVSVFAIASSGALTEVTGSPFSTRGFQGLLSLTAFPPKACTLTVDIEIKPPALTPVPINPASRGKIPVAILSTASFNAVTQVDTTSLTFGQSGNEPSLALCNADGEDVNGDGLADLVCHFNTQQTGFVAGDTTAVLKGKTITGRAIQAAEAIRTIPQ